MHRLRTFVTLLAVSMAPPVAYADFVVTGAPASSAPSAGTSGGVVPGSGVVSDEPHLDAGDRRPALAKRPPIRERPRVVVGFGDQVPLSFACRQIVPASVTVSYGPGADPGMLVTWQGGDTWPHVLSNAIKPLGLRMISSGTRIEIED